VTEITSPALVGTAQTGAGKKYPAPKTVQQKKWRIDAREMENILYLLLVAELQAVSRFACAVQCGRPCLLRETRAKAGDFMEGKKTPKAAPGSEPGVVSRTVRIDR
jgi:hypothetical protein